MSCPYFAGLTTAKLLWHLWIWMWFNESRWCFCNSRYSPNRKINERNLIQWGRVLGRVVHICISIHLFVLPIWHQAITQANGQLLPISQISLKISFEIQIEIQMVSFKRMHLKKSSAKWQPFCLNLNVLSNTHTRAILPCLHIGFHHPP